MPKIKTHKGAQDRFGITGSGKLMRNQGRRSHFRRRRAARVKRLYDEMVPVSSVDKPRIKRLLPYGVR